MKQQRAQLEADKQVLIDEIQELDQLKNMLMQKKQDTTTGFKELAESNKEVISIKSGEFFNRDKTQSAAFSRGS